MATQEVSRRILARAAAHAGGTAQLAAKLGISPRVAERYLTGHEVITESLLLRAIDVILEQVPKKALE